MIYLMTEVESLPVTSLNLHHSAELQHVLNKECVRSDTVSEQKKYIYNIFLKYSD